MNKNEISIATITWARNDEEEKLLIDSLQHLAKINIPVVITDGGSRREFLDFLKSFPHFTLLHPDEKGLLFQAKTSLSAAYKSGSKYIFYTEPDKQDFFKDSLKRMIENISINGKTGIILASRSEKSFATFPPFQQMTETTINNCCREIITKSFDYTYGPFILNRNLVPFLEDLKADIGWGWRPYIFNVAHRLGYDIDTYVHDFICPPELDTLEEHIYRMRQLSQNIDGLTLSTLHDLEKNPR